MADDIIYYVTLMANHISRMRTFPYLDGVHNVVMCLLFREGDKGCNITYTTYRRMTYLKIIVTQK